MDRIYSLFLTFSILLSGAQSLHADVVLDNMDSLTNILFSVDGIHDVTRAQGFRLDDDTDFSSVTIVGRTTHSNQDFRVQLYSSSAGNPGSVLATLQGETSPQSWVEETYVAPSPVFLTANTEYFFVFSSIGLQSNYDVFGVTNTSEIGNGEINNYSHSMLGSNPNWGTINSVIGLRIRGTSVPEPASGIVVAALGTTTLLRRRRRA
ncbi:MAG: choice-of-anchor R domain-containing protein [Planctomycetota bacterium]